MERSHQVLALGEVHGGLPADRRVHLRRERGRHLHERGATHVGGRDEPCQIAGRATSQRDDRVVSMRFLRRELMQERAIDVEGLRFLTGRDEERHGVEPGSIQRGREGWEPGVVHGAVGHDEGLGRAGERRQQFVGAVEHARTHDHLVGPPGDPDGHALQRSSSTIASATSPGGPLPSTTCAANSR